ncbi:MAG: flavodoxin family protein [Bacteroidetes bacterium]|nr:flavodoxin family protein [Bacteroidota bacterium]
MKKYLILYYSKTGNCKFVAEKLSREFTCDIEMINPGINNTGILFLLSLMNISVPVNTSISTIGSMMK